MSDETVALPTWRAVNPAGDVRAVGDSPQECAMLLASGGGTEVAALLRAQVAAQLQDRYEVWGWAIEPMPSA